MIDDEYQLASCSLDIGFLFMTLEDVYTVLMMLVVVTGGEVVAFAKSQTEFA
jgi:hypothetical protein